MKKRWAKRITTIGLLVLFGLAVIPAAASWLGDDDDEQGPRYTDWGTPVNLGPIVNSTSQEFSPAISRDGRSLYFASNRPGGFGGLDIWVSHRYSVDDPWGPPQNLGPNVNTPFADAGLSLSLDGHRLYFHSDRPGGFGGQDLYVSRRRNKRDDFGWRPAENVGSGVNTPAHERRPFQFEDDETGDITLYFDSDRPGGPGGNDIYASFLRGDDDDEAFGPAFLIPELSTPFNDEGPRMRRDGLEVFLASNRPGSILTLSPTATDIWVATRPSTADPWAAPLHLEPPINDAFVDSGAALSFDGTALYFNPCRPAGSVGMCDLWVTMRSKLRHHNDDDCDDEARRRWHRYRDRD